MMCIQASVIREKKFFSKLSRNAIQTLNPFFISFIFSACNFVLPVTVRSDAAEEEEM